MVTLPLDSVTGAEAANVLVPLSVIVEPEKATAAPVTEVVVIDEVKVPPESVNAPVIAKLDPAPEPPVKVPEDTVSPELILVVPVVALYVPPATVRRPENVVVDAAAVRLPPLILTVLPKVLVVP